MTPIPFSMTVMAGSARPAKVPFETAKSILLNTGILFLWKRKCELAWGNKKKKCEEWVIYGKKETASRILSLYELF